MGTSPLIAWGIEEECGVAYHRGPVRKLLPSLGYSVQRPRRLRARADARQQDRWHRHTYAPLKKAPRENRALIFTDEASFRQDSTLHAPGSRVGRPPAVSVTGGGARAARSWAPSNSGIPASIRSKIPSSLPTAT